MSKKPIHADESNGQTDDVANFTAGNLKVGGAEVLAGGGITTPGSTTNNAIPKWVGAAGDELANSAVLIDGSNNITGVAALTATGQVQGATLNATGNITVGGTVDGRDVATDGSKLDGIAAGAQPDQSDSEIETAYNNQVSVVSQVEAEAGTSTTVRRWTAQRVGQAIAALGGGGGGGTPAGSDRDVQINNAGAFGNYDGFNLNSTGSLALKVDGPGGWNYQAAVGTGNLQFGYRETHYSATEEIGNASGKGSLSFGVIDHDAYGGGHIASTARGGLSGGVIDCPNTASARTHRIQAEGDGAFAFGFLQSNSASREIRATANASMAFGDASAGNIIASAVGAVQFCQGTNSRPNSVAVGNYLRFHAGKYSYSPPPSVRNGDQWLGYDGGFDTVYIRSRGNNVKIM